MKILNALSTLVLLSAFVLIGYLFMMIVYPSTIVEQKSPAKVLTPTVKIGESLHYIADYCKNIDIIPSALRRQLVGDQGYAYDLPVSLNSNLKKGCHKVLIEVPMIVPITIPTDRKYYIIITAEYDLNFLRKETYTFTTEEFNITK